MRSRPVLAQLLDEDASMLVLGPQAAWCCIEAWKLVRATALASTDGASGADTARHDTQAFKYLAAVLVPLVSGWAVYSLTRMEHAGWYSYALHTAVSAVYALGFALMTPQLFINYRLKSVPPLPWKSLVYRSLNTVMDDFFAMLVRLPTLHRVSVFRDDLVLLIYLCQRRWYKVDVGRPADGVDGDKRKVE